MLDKRLNPVTGQLEYLLQWKNWDGEPTWEPADNCDCHELIARYEASVAPGPRSKSPVPQVCCDSSCSEASDCDYESWEHDIKERKLLLKEIVGAVNGGEEIVLIVKWHGISGLEKVPLQVLRRFHCQDILDFLLQKIKWREN